MQPSGKRKFLLKLVRAQDLDSKTPTCVAVIRVEGRSPRWSKPVKRTPNRPGCFEFNFVTVTHEKPPETEVAKEEEEPLPRYTSSMTIEIHDEHSCIAYFRLMLHDFRPHLTTRVVPFALPAGLKGSMAVEFRVDGTRRVLHSVPQLLPLDQAWARSLFVMVGQTRLPLHELAIDLIPGVRCIQGSGALASAQQQPGVLLVTSHRLLFIPDAMPGLHHAWWGQRRRAQRASTPPPFTLVTGIAHGEVHRIDYFLGMDPGVATRNANGVRNATAGTAMGTDALDDQTSKHGSLRIWTKTARFVELHVATQDSCQALQRALLEVKWRCAERRFAYQPDSWRHGHHQHRLRQQQQQQNGSNMSARAPPLPLWEVGDALLADLKRQGVLESSLWRVSTANTQFRLCRSYPPLLVVPADVSDNDLSFACKSRKKDRLPVLTWLHPINGAPLLRASQSIAHRNLQQMTVLAAERLMDSYASKSQNDLRIVDCRHPLDMAYNFVFKEVSCFHLRSFGPRRYGSPRRAFPSRGASLNQCHTPSSPGCY